MVACVLSARYVFKTGEIIIHEKNEGELIMSTINVERKPSGTARGTALLRTLANKEFNDDKLGSDYFAEYFFALSFKIFAQSKKN